MFLGDTEHQFAERLEVFRLQAQRADRVLSVRVETGADQHQLWPTALGRVGQHRLEAREVLAASGAELQRQVEDRSETFSFSGFFRVAGAGIKRGAMCREEMNLAVLVEDVLRAVAVMHVPIDDQNSPQPVRLSLSRRNRDAVEQTKTHRIVGQCVMPRGADEAQRSAMFRVGLQNLIDRGAGSTGGSDRDLERTSAANGVRFDAPAAVLAEAFDAADVPGRVDSQKLLLRGDGDLAFHTGLIEFLRGQLRGDAAKPLRLLRMLAGVVFEKDRIGEEDRHGGLASVAARGSRAVPKTREPRVSTSGGLCQTRGCSTTFLRRL